MSRRLTGLAVLVAAVLAAVVTPLVLHPGLAGKASPAPLPEPPAVGACVTVDDRSIAFISVAVADCSDPHDGEVVARWLADDDTRPRDQNTTACDGPLARYTSVALPAALDAWQVTVAGEALLVWAPAAERVGTRGWTACVVSPARGSSYRGSVAGMAVDGRPTAFGRCAVGPPRTIVPCNAPHTTEELGVTAASATVSGDAADQPSPALYAALSQQCRAIAALMTGAADPTYADRLRTDSPVTDVELTLGQQPGESVLSYRSTCSVVSGSQLLTDSVVGLGNAPLPVN